MDRVPRQVPRENRPEVAQVASSAKALMDKVRAGEMSLEDAKRAYSQQNYKGEAPPEYDYSTIELPKTPWSMIGGR
jgi:hypothetical protein